MARSAGTTVYTSRASATLGFRRAGAIRYGAARESTAMAGITPEIGRVTNVVQSPLPIINA